MTSKRWVAADPARLRQRLEEVAADLPHEISVRPMMGGFVGYADGRVFVSLSPGGFGIKLLPGDQAELLARPGADRMRHAPDQPASKTYITLSIADIADDDVLLGWLRRAADTAPAAKPKPKRATA